VAGDARQVLALRPAAVAVHDDGDVPGQLLGPQPERRAQDEVQKMTDRHVADIDKLLAEKEKELLAV